MSNLYALGIGGVLLGLLIWGAVEYGYARCERDQATANLAALNEATKQRDELQVKLNEIEKENTQLEDELRRRPLRANLHASDIHRSNTCNYSLGAVGLLNEARGYQAGTPDNPAIPAAEAGEPSTLTGEAALGHWEECEIRYQVAKTRHNNLVDACSLLQ